MNRPLITVIIPVYNGVKYLRDAYKSVKNSLFDCVDIIIVDDGSEDKTLLFAEAFDAKIFSIEHGGLSKARNVGLENSNSDFILFLDCDDILASDNSIHLLFQPFESDGKISATQAMVKDFISLDLPDIEKQTIHKRDSPYYGLLTGAMLFKRNVFDIAGMFDESLQSGQGVDFLLRLQKFELEVKRIPYVTCFRRLHDSNMGRTMRQQENVDYASLLRRKLHK
jgi:glycosyltransferase involved in cell wall biosynthesis